MCLWADTISPSLLASDLSAVLAREVVSVTTSLFSRLYGGSDSKL